MNVAAGVIPGILEIPLSYLFAYELLTSVQDYPLWKFWLYVFSSGQ